MNERSIKYKGKFTPQNSSKYIGDSDNIVYRSMWERRCMKRSTVLYEAKTYQMNRDKFASARKWCDERDITFDIWTEKHLQMKG